VEFEWFGGPDPLWHSTWGREPRWITRRGFPLDGALLSFSRPPCSHSHNATGPGFPCRGRFRHRKRTPLPFAAAQTRIVSAARPRLELWKSVRPFKGIFCDDISEFESYMPSHAVVSPGMRGVMSAPFGLARHLWADVARASIADAHSPPTLETMFATCDVRHRAPPSL